MEPPCEARGRRLVDDVPYRHVVARAALIAALAMVALPGLADSRPPTHASVLDPVAFTAAGDQDASGSTTTTLHLQFPPTLDAPSGTAFLPDTEIGGPWAGAEDPPSPTPSMTPVVVNRWHTDRNVSWYGPGFYGNRTACGIALSTTTLGVANRTLPCGTRVTFRNPRTGRSLTVTVIDRGPYVAGRQWDLTGGTCLALDHCYTGELIWRLA
jgi:hypothetical protein